MKITVLIFGKNTFNLIIGKKFALKCEILHIKLVFIDIITNKKLQYSGNSKLVSFDKSDKWYTT